MIRAICLLACLAALAAAGAETVTLTVSNPLDATRPDAICVGPASLLGDVAPGAYMGVTRAGAPVAVQVDDLDADGAADELVMVLDLPPAGEMTVWVDTSRAWPGADFADVRTSWRYDDYAALDTDRMGFGLYGIFAPHGDAGRLQWDLYGKRPEAWRLSLDALEGVNYHEDNPVAVDYLLVGTSMALGGPIIGEARPASGENGQFEYRAICNGPVRAGLQVRVTGWATPAGGSYDATIRYFVYAHHDFLDARFDIATRTPCPGAFGLGVRRLPHPDVFLGSSDAGILALMGQQPGIIGRTGLAVVFDPASFLRWGVQADGDDAYVVRLRPAPNGTYRAWLVGVWEHGGIATPDSFADHINGLAARFGVPTVVAR